MSKSAWYATRRSNLPRSLKRFDKEKGICVTNASPTNRIFFKCNWIIYYKKARVVWSDRAQLSGDSGFESRAAFMLSCWPNGKAPDYEALFTVLLCQRIVVFCIFSQSCFWRDESNSARWFLRSSFLVWNTCLWLCIRRLTFAPPTPVQWWLQYYFSAHVTTGSDNKAISCRVVGAGWSKAWYSKSIHVTNL